MFKMKFYNFVIFSNGTQNRPNGTQILPSILLDHFYSYSAPFRTIFNDFKGGPQPNALRTTLDFVPIWIENMFR